MRLSFEYESSSTFSRDMNTLRTTDQYSDMAYTVSMECLKRPWSFETEDVEGVDLRGRKRAIRANSEHLESHS